jgi:ferredoxin
MGMIMNRLAIISTFFLVLGLLFAAAIPPGLTCEDESCKESTLSSQEADPQVNLGSWLASLYRDNISAVDSDRCPSVPTCSSYAVEVFQKHSFIMGWLMTVDRLIHEGEEETSVSPLIYSEGRWKIFDPIENNDFWWYSQDREGHE